MTLTSASWRRVASTHSLSDLLLESDPGPRTDTRSPPKVRGRTLYKAALGMTLMMLGLAGTAFSFFIGYSCFPRTVEDLRTLRCSEHALSLFFTTFIEGGMHMLVLPVLRYNSTIWERICGVPLPLFDRAVEFLEHQYPLERDEFFEALERRGINASEVVVYCFAIIPILLGPVTIAMIAMNWFSLKVFKHN